MSNFWGILDLPLNNCKTEFDLSWWKECVISEISKTYKVIGNLNDNQPVPDVTAIQTVGVTL